MLAVTIHTPSGRDHKYDTDAADIRVPTQQNIRLLVKNSQIIVTDDHANEPVQAVITLY